jgi:hypothetical protein
VSSPFTGTITQTTSTIAIGETLYFTTVGYDASGNETEPTFEKVTWTPAGSSISGQPVTIDDETATIPGSRQLVDGVGTTVDLATPGKVSIDIATVSLPGQSFSCSGPSDLTDPANGWAKSGDTGTNEDWIIGVAPPGASGCSANWGTTISVPSVTNVTQSSTISQTFTGFTAGQAVRISIDYHIWIVSANLIVVTLSANGVSNSGSSTAFGHTTPVYRTLFVDAIADGSGNIAIEIEVCGTTNRTGAARFCGDAGVTPSTGTCLLEFESYFQRLAFNDGSIIPIGGIGSGTSASQPITVDDETATVPGSRQLVDGQNTTVNRASAGEIAIDVSPTTSLDTFDAVFEFFGVAAGATSGRMRLDPNCDVVGWTIVGDVSGDAEVDIEKSPVTNPPVWTSIAGTNLPTLASEELHEDTTLSGWGTTGLTGPLMLRAVLNTITTCTEVTVSLTLKRT